jgi:hypothetical protein
VSFSLIEASGWTHRHGDAKRRFSLQCERKIKLTKEEKRVTFDWFLPSGYNEFISVVYISQILQFLKRGNSNSGILKCA